LTPLDPTLPSEPLVPSLPSKPGPELPQPTKAINDSATIIFFFILLFPFFIV
jgi:hypothetical protein